MPFSDNARRIAGLFQQFGNGDFIRMKALAGSPVEDISQINTLGSAAGHKSGPGGRTAVVHVDAGKLHALLSQLVDVGCRNVFGAKASQIAIAEVVGKEKYDIRL